MINNYLKIAKEYFTTLKDVFCNVFRICARTKAGQWCWYSSWGLLLVISLINGLRGGAKGLSDSTYIIIMVIIVFIVRRIRPSLISKWSYFEEKPSAPYIMLFMIILLICAFLLIIKLESVAEQMANIAYFLLVVGVGIEFYQLIKEKKREG